MFVKHWQVPEVNLHLSHILLRKHTVYKYPRGDLPPRRSSDFWYPVQLASLFELDRRIEGATRWLHDSSLANEEDSKYSRNNPRLS